MSSTRTEHRFALAARCPLDDAEDVYDVAVVLESDIPVVVDVHELVRAARRLAAEPTFQEPLTRAIADWLRENSRTLVEISVTTTGRHGVVDTSCCCS